MRDEMSHAERLRCRRADLASKEMDMDVLARRLQRAHDRDHFVLVKQLTGQIARLRGEIDEGRRLLLDLESEVDG